MTGRLRASPAAFLLAPALALMLALPATSEVPVPPARPTHNLHGMTGLIDNPTARMQPDGQVSLSAGHFSGFTRTTLSAQILPELEVAFRYSVIDDFFDNPAFRPTLYDRSFDLKLRLLREGALWPEVAVGLQDFLGTGVYSGEYLVATKGFLGGALEVTGGIGWGRFATLNGFNNPVGLVIDRARTRDDSRTFGGQVNFGQFFQGPDAGVFGGVQWHTPVDGLSVTVEYGNDDYAREREFSDFEQAVPINFGLDWKPVNWASLSAYWMYGREAGLRVTLTGNIFDPPAGVSDAPPALPLVPRPVPPAARERADAALGEVLERTADGPLSSRFAANPYPDPASVRIETDTLGTRWAVVEVGNGAGCPDDAAGAIDAAYGVVDAVRFLSPSGAVLCTVALRPAGQDAVRLIRRAALEAPGAWPTGWAEEPATLAALRDALHADLVAEGLRLIALEAGPDRATVHIENRTYRETPRAIGRTARALSRIMPPSVAEFVIVPVEDGLPTVAVTLARARLEDQAHQPDAARGSWLGARIADAPPLSGSAARQAWADQPRFTWSVDPQVPISLFDPDEPLRYDLALVARAGLSLGPGLSLNAAAQKRVVGNLDDIKRESDSTLPRARSDFAEYLREGDPGIARLTGDYVTKLAPDLYGRVSAGLLETMYAGASVEALWKPADQSWGLGAEINHVRQRDFDQLFDLRDYDVTTGHVSLYWDTPWQGLAVQVDAGRYLAGDWGGTFTLSRRFDNGWEIGAFATFTDVSFDEFGEGSFDKGIVLTIPLDWALPFETRSTLASVIRPLSRDGGQRLNIAKRLYPVVADQDRGGLRRSWGGFWE